MTEQSDAPAETPVEAPDWRAALPPELVGAAEKFATPEAVLKSYVALEKHLGRAVVLPGEKADPEELARFHRRLGVPERPEDYDVHFPEPVGSAAKGRVPTVPGTEDRDREARFLATMQAAGAPPAVVQAAVDWFGAELASLSAGHAARAAQSEAHAEAELRGAWGSTFDRNLALARRALRHFAREEGEALSELPLGNGGRLGSHPGFLSFLRDLGAGLLEDRPLIGAPGGDGASLATRIDALHALPPEQYKSAPVQQELRDLYGRLHGDPEGQG